MTAVYFSPGPTPIIIGNGPTSMLSVPQPTVGWSPGPPAGSYIVQLDTPVYQNFILWTNIISESQDGSDSTYGDFSSTPASQGFWTSVTTLGANPSDRSKGKLVFKAKHTSGGGTVYIDVFLQNLANYYHFVLDIPITLTTSWAWYSYDLDGTGNVLGLPDYTDANLGLIVRNAGAYANQPFQISELWIDAYAV